ILLFLKLKKIILKKSLFNLNYLKFNFINLHISIIFQFLQFFNYFLIFQQISFFIMLNKLNQLFKVLYFFIQILIFLINFFIVYIQSILFFYIYSFLVFFFNQTKFIFPLIFPVNLFSLNLQTQIIFFLNFCNFIFQQLLLMQTLGHSEVIHYIKDFFSFQKISFFIFLYIVFFDSYLFLQSFYLFQQLIISTLINVCLSFFQIKQFLILLFDNGIIIFYFFLGYLYLFLYYLGIILYFWKFLFFFQNTIRFTFLDFQINLIVQIFHLLSQILTLFQQYFNIIIVICIIIYCIFISFYFYFLFYGNSFFFIIPKLSTGETMFRFQQNYDVFFYDFDILISLFSILLPFILNQLLLLYYVDFLFQYTYIKRNVFYRLERIIN
ncbi:hypothetical protein IMG5_002270, partial [Ichthyophthirius multifiliis]